MRHRPLRHFLLGLLALAALSACHDKDQQKEAELSGGATPEEAIQDEVKLIRAGDFAGFWKHALPPADYATLRTDWPREHPGQLPGAEDRAQFEAKMKEFTEPGAEDKLYAEARPKLIQMQQQYSDQLPFMIGVMQGIARSAIDQRKDMTQTQKKQANDVLDVVVPWAQQQAWFDQAKARQSIATLVATARKLDIKSADQLQAMDFDTAMRKYSAGYLGIKEVLTTYGLSLDQALDSVKVTTLENAYGYARVKIDYVLLGKPLSTESTLMQQDGRWYSEDLLKNVRDAHQRLSMPAVVASAPAPTSSTHAASIQTPASDKR